jgi:hypothetical protein
MTEIKQTRTRDDLIALATELGAITEWGACRRGETEPFVSGEDEAAVRRLAADLPNTVTGLVQRQVTPWVDAGL